MAAIQLEIAKYGFSRSDGKKFIFTNKETGEEVNVKKELIGNLEAYLKRKYKQCLWIVAYLFGISKLLSPFS